MEVHLDRSGAPTSVMTSRSDRMKLLGTLFVVLASCSSADRAVKFTPQKTPAKTIVEVTGDGAVLLQHQRTKCFRYCEFTFPAGTPIVATALADDRSFLGWSGDCEQSGVSCQTVSPSLVVANFAARGRSALWIKKLGAERFGYADAIDVDTLGGLFGLSTVNSDVHWAPSVLKARGSLDVIISRILPDGTPGWATLLGGPASELGNDLVVDSAGNPVVAVWVAATATLGPKQVIPGPGVFVLRLAGIDGRLLWAARLPDGLREWRVRVAAQGNGVFVLGVPKVGVANSGIRSDVQVSKLTLNSGSLEWTQILHGAGFGVNNGFQVTAAQGRIFMVGSSGARLEVLAIDAQDGRQLWRAVVTCSIECIPTRVKTRDDQDVCVAGSRRGTLKLSRDLSDAHLPAGSRGFLVCWSLLGAPVSVDASEWPIVDFVHVARRIYTIGVAMGPTGRKAVLCALTIAGKCKWQTTFDYPGWIRSAYSLEECQGRLCVAGTFAKTLGVGDVTATSIADVFFGAFWAD